MLISLNELKKLTKIALSDAELFDLIGSRLVEIESVEDLSKKYKNIWIVKVETCEKIEGTHLSRCEISCPGKSETPIQVVCGAPNVRAEMLAVWIAPGAIVPATFGGENFEIGSRKLRGFESNGMLAGLDELALGDDHSGIVEIDPAFAKPGDSFAEKFDLNDKIIEVENKSLTHRPDCFGLIGFAREIAGILGEKFEEPSLNFELLPEDFNNKEEVSIETDPTLCEKYSAAVFEVSKTNLKTALEADSFLTTDAVFLVKAGMRSINKIVDATNITMLLTGQPLHAFDYDKFLAVGKTDFPKIGVRLARPGEKLTLLDDKEIELEKSDILITSNDAPVALAGAMGGKSTEIDENTKKIILESATFSLYNLRKTQMAHGIFSETITRFTKGQPAAGTVPALARCSALLLDSPEKISALKVSASSASNLAPISVSLEEINSLLGSTYSAEQVIRTLDNVGIELLEKSDDSLRFKVPAWRTDLKIKEDIIEEVGRLLGYDNLSLAFPTRSFKASKTDEILSLASSLRSLLSENLGFNEILTYSFVSETLLKKVNLDPENSYKIINSISPELQRFRTSLLPSLLEKSYENLKSGFKDFTLYEINQISEKSFGLDEDGVPVLKKSLGLVSINSSFYFEKAVLKEIASFLGLDFELRPLSSHSFFEPLRSAEIFADNLPLGVFGEFKNSVLKNFKLSAPVSGLSLDLETVSNLLKNKKSAAKTLKLSRFPFVSRDLTLRVAAETPFETLEKSLNETLKNERLVYELSPVSIYQNKNNREGKNISFHLSFAAENKTLNSAEISAIMEKITKNLAELGAEVV